MSRVPAAILEERQRQITAEGWTAEHDDEHANGEMLTVAVHYLWAGTEKAATIQQDGAPLGWPWDAHWWKPRDRLSNLVRAGALCLAEIERIQRAHNREWSSPRNRDRAAPPYIGHVLHKLDLIVAEIEAGAGLSQPKLESDDGR